MLRETLNQQQIHAGLRHADYAFADGNVLPAGDWHIRIENGDAWVFSNGREHILHAGDTMHVKCEDGATRIRSLYVRGFARYQLSRI